MKHPRFLPSNVITVLAFLASGLSAFAAGSTWVPTAAAGYDFKNAAYWNNGIPNGVDAVANMNNDIVGDQTVSLQNVTLGTWNLGDANGSNKFTFNWNGGLTFQVSSGHAQLTLTAAGTSVNSLNNSLTLNSSLDITANGGQYITS